MQRLLSCLLPLLLLLLLPLTALGAGDRSVPGQAGSVRVGEPAPDFTLKDVNGRSYTLSQLRGKVVLVNFWATWCPPCRAEMPSMEKLNAMLPGKDFVLLAINVEEEGRENVQEFLQQNPHTFPVLLDAKTEVQQQYGVFAYPETFIVRPDGIIADHVVGAMDWTGPQVVSFLKFLIFG